MRKFIIGGTLLALTACVSSEQQAAWDQAVAALPPGAASYCEMQSQQASAGYYNPRAVLGLESIAAGNKMRGTCLRMMIERNGGGFESQPLSALARSAPDIDAPNVTNGKAMVREHIALYGEAPVQACFRQADQQPVSNEVKGVTYIRCISQLRPL